MLDDRPTDKMTVVSLDTSKKNSFKNLNNLYFYSKQFIFFTFEIPSR